MPANHHETDIAIIGGGIAGIVAALEIHTKNPAHHITIIERGTEADFGGLAKLAFGGMALVGTPAQKRLRIPDTPEIALADWHAFAEFGADDFWPKAWAKYYIDNSNEKVYHWLKERGIHFFPAVQWVERGLQTRGNSLPRYHILWGTSQFMTESLVKRLFATVPAEKLTILYNHRVDQLTQDASAVAGCSGSVENSDTGFTVKAAHTIVATGGVGGSIDQVKRHWPKDWTESGAPAPEIILNGCTPHTDGIVHEATQQIGGRVTHLDWMWNYAAGIPHPTPKFEGHGLSLIPTRSSLWMDHRGRRIGPDPLITGFDTNHLCKQVAAQEKPWTWHVMNMRIAAKELAISGAEHNPYIRDKNIFKFLTSMVLGDGRLIKKMMAESDYILSADTLPELVAKMNATTDAPYIETATMRGCIEAYDTELDKAEKFQTDSQIRRIWRLREWLGDKIRTCKAQKILDEKAGPLVAIKTHLIARKTLGGIQTDLHCRVLDNDGQPIAGLFAIGEAAGFGGGGASGKRSLEGTFLPGCILTGQKVAENF